jgi:hypothetical protein
LANYPEIFYRLPILEDFAEYRGKLSPELKLTHKQLEQLMGWKLHKVLVCQPCGNFYLENPDISLGLPEIEHKRLPDGREICREKKNAWIKGVVRMWQDFDDFIDETSSVILDLPQS